MAVVAGSGGQSAGASGPGTGRASMADGRRVYCSLASSDLGPDGGLEAVLRFGGALRHFSRPRGPGAAWRAGRTIVDAGVAGPGCLIQSDLGTGNHGNFEVVVPITNPTGSTDLRHYFRDNSQPDAPWQAGQIVAPDVAGPGCLIQSDLGTGNHGNFEVVVPLRHGDAFQLRHFFHDNSDVALPWRPAQFVTDCAAGWAGLVSARRRGRRQGGFDVLVEERTRSVVAYTRHNRDLSTPWLRAGVLDGEPLSFVGTRTRRICQVTGEWDRTGWTGTGTPPFAPNRTQSRSGIRGTDLGVSFEHRGRTYFLFGDTARVGRPPWEARNAIAWTDARDPGGGLPLSFLPTWPRIVPPIRQGRFNVPLDGVSDGEAMYVFFTTDAHTVAGRDLMGRSVLARSTDDGARFHLLRTLSSYRFVNVSIQRGVLEEDAAAPPGWAPGRELLWIWGTGRYRSSDIYLAVVPFDQLRQEGPFDLRFFSGDRNGSHWSGREEDATPVILNGAVGELSVRWNQPLQRFLAMFTSDNPRAVLLHSAARPWGPWTPEPIGLFDATRLTDPDDPCSAAGYGNFMHVPWSVRRCDHTQDDVFGRRRDDEWGGEYASYQIGHLSTPTADGCVLYYLLSTWNPYQVMLMATPLTREQVG